MVRPSAIEIGLHGIATDPVRAVIGTHGLTTLPVRSHYRPRQSHYRDRVLNFWPARELFGAELLGVISGDVAVVDGQPIFAGVSKLEMEGATLLANDEAVLPQLY